MIFENDKDITALTTFGIPVRTKHYAEYSSLKELEKISRSPIFLENDVFHIGGGSNLLFTQDFPGLILKSDIKGITEYGSDPDRIFLIAGAAEKWTDLVDYALDHNLAGLENLAGIPGEVGASAIQNVGAYGVEAKDVIFAVECFDSISRQTRRFSNEECQFGYRDSFFKHEGRGRYFVLRVSFLLRRSDIASNLTYGPLKNLKDKLGHAPTIQETAAEIISIRNAKLPDPMEIGSAGSFFKNPIVNRHYFNEEIGSRADNVPFYDVDDFYVKLPAAWLIEHAGLKDSRIGGAYLYPTQPLVIANDGSASADDVCNLARLIEKRVHDCFGVSLRPEVNIIDPRIHIKVLGSGTSKGIPEIGCSCHVCRSDDPHDKRTRTSVIVEASGLNILIDASPDLRQQFLDRDIRKIDAVLLTHGHYDHTGGIDDLRPFCSNGSIPMYVRRDVDEDLRRRMEYCFRKHPYPGVPNFDMNIISDDPFFIQGLKIVPVEVMHGSLPIFGYRIGDFAYVTDAKTISDEELEKLYGVKVLILNALRHKDHFSHLTLTEALSLIRRINPERAYLTHFNHRIGTNAELEKSLPEGVFPAYDGLEITC